MTDSVGRRPVGLYTRRSPPNTRQEVGYGYAACNEMEYSRLVGVYAIGPGYKAGDMVGPYTGERVTETEIMIKSG